jgi:hypothetical protein
MQQEVPSAEGGSTVSAAARVILDSVRSAGWAPAGVFLLHVILSVGFGAYRKWPPLDIPMHFVGGVAMAYFLAVAIAHPLAKARIGALRRSGTFLMVIGLTTVVALKWEWVEWTANAMFGAKIHMNLEDTLADLALGIAGAAVLLAARWNRHS